MSIEKSKRPESVPDYAATRVIEAAARMFIYIRKRAEEGDVEAVAIEADILTPTEERNYRVSLLSSEKQAPLRFCPQCGLTMCYQNEDADGPCDQWVCCGVDVDGIEYRGCFNYVEATPEEARRINPR